MSDSFRSLLLGSIGVMDRAVSDGLAVTVPMFANLVLWKRMVLAAALPWKVLRMEKAQLL